MTEKKSCAKGLVDIGISVIKACQLTSLSRSEFYRKEVDWRVKDKLVIKAI